MSKAIKIKQIFLILLDIICFYIALLGLIFFRFHFSKIYGLEIHFNLFTIMLGPWLAIFYIVGLYEIRDLKDKKRQFQKFISGIIVGSFIMVGFFYFVPDLKITPKINLLIFVVLFSIIDYFGRKIYAILIVGKLPRENAVLIGSGEAVEDLENFLLKNPQVGINLKKTVKDENGDIFKNFSDFLKSEKIHLIIISSRINKTSLASGSIASAMGRGFRVKNIVEVYETIFRKIPLSEIDDFWIAENILNRRNAYQKIIRPFEIILSLLSLVIIIPVSLAIALFIKISSPGSAFFSQIRVGKNQKNFVLWKFRTMKPDAEKSGPQWSKPGDSRVIPIGKILRLTHLDELPQIWNIIKGNLSFIGPRPERPEFVVKLEKQIPYYNLRHILRPGIAGWAQLNYRYGASVEESLEKLQYDLYYLKNRSLFLDAIIIIKTIRRFFVPAQ